MLLHGGAAGWPLIVFVGDEPRREHKGGHAPFRLGNIDLPIDDPGPVPVTSVPECSVDSLSIQATHPLAWTVSSDPHGAVGAHAPTLRSHLDRARQAPAAQLDCLAASRPYPGRVAL